MKRNHRILAGPAGVLLAGLFFALKASPALGAGVPLGPARRPVGRLEQLPTSRPQPAAAGRPKIELRASAQLDADGLPAEIRGKMVIKDWRTGAGPRCLYLPYADSDYGLDRAVTRRQEMFADKNGRQVFEGGRSTLSSNGLPLLAPGAIIQLDDPADELTLNFESRVPRLAGTTPDEWFFDGFAPRLLSFCPSGGTAPRDLPGIAADIDYSIKIPDGWDFIGPGVLTAEGSAAGRLTAAHVAFALTRGQRRIATEIAGLHVDFVFRSHQFLDLIPTVERALPLLIQMFGEYPFNKSITFVETAELQRSGLPGLIAVNRAPQGLFDKMQTGWMNWMHWLVVSQLVKEWYGGAIAPRSARDEWLTAGIAEFAVAEALSRDNERFNLFAEYKPGVRILSLTFRQVTELTAATLRRVSPFATITTPLFDSINDQREQPPLLFVKHAEAMMQMKGLAGEQAFFGFMRQLTAAYLHKTMAPSDFYAFLGRRPSPFSPTVRDELQDSLKQWWTNVGWPDFKLEDFKDERLADGRWLAEMTASQRGEIDFPPLFGVLDEAGKTYFVRAEAKKKDGLWHAVAPMGYRPIRVDVDPLHEAFDDDRFNNSSEPTTLQFFPGGAETLRDDAYTVVWLPYIYRLPAQPWSVGVSGAAFKYITQALFMKFEVAPKEKLGGGEIRKRFTFDDSAVQLDLNLTQDYYNARVAEAGIARSPIWNGEPQAGIALRTRYKQQVGITDSRHQTFVVAASVKSIDPLKTCHAALAGEFEKTPPKFAKGFDYERSLGSLAGDCNVTPRTGLGARVFYGMLRSSGEVPDQALFRPTELKEARLRIDDSGLGLLRRVASASSDLLLPFYLPLPSDSMLLTRQLRWRLFYDYGRALEPVHEYRSAGMGFLLPFGGDLAGAGTLSLTKLTLLGIFYSNVDGKVSRMPSVVFDLSGDL